MSIVLDENQDPNSKKVLKDIEEEYDKALTYDGYDFSKNNFNKHKNGSGVTIIYNCKHSRKSTKHPLGCPHYVYFI